MQPFTNLLYMFLNLRNLLCDLPLGEEWEKGIFALAMELVLYSAKYRPGSSKLPFYIVWLVDTLPVGIYGLIIFRIMYMDFMWIYTNNGP